MNNIKNYQKNILGVIISVVVIFSIATFFIEILQITTNQLSETENLKTKYKKTLEELKEVDN